MTSPTKSPPRLNSRLPIIAFLSAAIFTLYLDVASLRAADSGVISGTVSNSATGNLLEGVRIDVPRLGLTAYTDQTGRYALNGLPAGTHEVVITYLGLDPVRRMVTLADTGRAEQNFELSTGVYKMNAFKVTGEREGAAAALTAQRNAENLKNVVAMDSFGNLPNMSASEVVMRLPGTAGFPSDEGLYGNFTIRGTNSALNSVTIDGAQSPGVSFQRGFGQRLFSITGTMFESLELIKGHTPDKGADSLSGTINMKTRSPLSMKEKRRTTYNVTARWAPPFLEQTPERERHRAHHLLTLAHQQIFDVFGGERNLAIALNVFTSENAVSGASTQFDYQNTQNPNAFIWDFRTRNNYNNRKQDSISLRTDYRWSPQTRFWVTLLGNNNFERHNRSWESRAFTDSATATPSATTGIVPGAFTSQVTVVRPVAGAVIDVQNNGPRNFYVRTRQVDFNAEHDYGRWQIDYAAGLGQTNLNNGDGNAGTLTMRLAGVGWIIDRTRSDLIPRFEQNGGPDFLNGANYRPTTNGLLNVNTQRDQQLRQFRLNARYQLPVSAPNYLKAGVSWREQRYRVWAKDDHRWNYIGTAALPTDPTIGSYHARETGQLLPLWQSNTFIDRRRPVTPSLWQEDRYYHESTRFSGTQGLTEAAQAAYVMAQGKLGRDGWLGRTGYLGGVRLEETAVDTWGWVRSRTLTTAAQQLADPVGSALRDFGVNYRTDQRAYRQPFPSVHAFHDITPNLKFRSAFSTSFGRAGFDTFVPAETPNETANTVSVSNPSIRPQTAKTWDVGVEYYFEPVGQVSLSWFHKGIRDYIIANQEARIIPSGADNGYNGEYVGWSERSTINGGSAVVQGWEFGYQQQFTFLPGALKGLSGLFNYTWIDSHGLFNGATYLTRRELQAFIPHTANAQLAWSYGRFSTRLLYNFTGEHLNVFNATPALRLYRRGFKNLNAGIAYQARPSLNFTLDAANVLNEPQVVYRGAKDRTQRTILNFVTLTAGINGRF